MPEFKKHFFDLAMSPRKVSISVFSLFFAWLLAVPFEGQVLYALAGDLNFDPRPMIFSAVAAHFAGLFLCGFVIKTIAAARKLLLFSILFSMLATALFFLPPSAFWMPLLTLSSFLAGGCVASWGLLYQAFTPANERIKTAADGLIYSNLLMILLNMAALHISPHTGLGLCLIVLAGAWFCTLCLPEVDDTVRNTAVSRDQPVNIARPLAFLYLFVAVITINSGLMYQVLKPAFEHLDWLASWYWALPYVAALYVMRNLPRTANRPFILYIGIAMIGFSFLAFMVLDRSPASYLLINTLMLGACGIYDLFWWSILGEMLDLAANPAAIFGIGLSANVLGVMAGGMTGRLVGMDGGQHSSLLALSIVCIVLVILPPLSKYLGNLLKTHVYLTAFAELPPAKQQASIRTLVTLGDLTDRESEIAALIVRGRTYRQVAAELCISENTVKTHVKNIYAKYNVQNRNQLLHLMIDHDISQLH